MAKKRRVVYRYPRRKRRRRSNKFTLPLAPIFGLAAGLWEPIKRAQYGDWIGALDEASQAYTGYSPKTKAWNPGAMRRGLIPLVVGLLVHKFVGGRPLNLNQMLGKANVPVIRI